MERIDQTFLYYLQFLMKIILWPIIRNRTFFINVILLLIVPSIINAYWINHEQYITISPIYKYGIKIRDGASFPYMLFIPFVFSYVLSTCSLILRFICNNIEKIYKILVYIPLIILFIINVFCLLNFGTMISPSIVMLMIETNSGETIEFFNTYIVDNRSILAFSISFLFIVWIIVSEKNANKIICVNSQTNNIKYCGILKLFLLSLFSLYMFQRCIDPIKKIANLFDCENLSDAELWYLSYPVNTNVFSNFLYSAYVMHLSKAEMGDAKKNTLAETQEIKTEKNINLVLVIGESFSKYHTNLYLKSHLPTNPRLQKMVNSGNLHIFENVISSYNLTSFVIRNLFSVNSIMDNEKWSDYPAFPILFKNAGYNVYLWDNQRTFGKADVSDFSIASYLFDDTIAHFSYTAYNTEVFQYDGELLKDYNKKICLTGNTNLIIFHLMGQHTMPEKRYPKGEGFDHFTMDSIMRPDLDNRRKTLIAHYENATLYNDWVISEIINLFADKEAIVIYLSDHGEELYDFRDHYGRTQEVEKTPELLKYQYEIPFMIWCSDMFIDKNPETIKYIKASRQKPFMNDNVCQILMGLVGMDTKYYHPERDLLSPLFVPYHHRNVQSTINYEKIRFGKTFKQ